MKISEEWQADQGLILPKSLVEKSKDDKQVLEKKFKKDFDSILSENSHRTDPYFIFYKASFDKLKPEINRQAFTIYEDKPPFISRSLVFWIDNSRGLCVLLWEVGKKTVKFNIKAAERLKGILRTSVAG